MYKCQNLKLSIINNRYTSISIMRFLLENIVSYLISNYALKVGEDRRFLSFLGLQIRFQLRREFLTAIKSQKFYEKLRFKSA